MDRPKCFVLTGMPGAGKTSLLTELRNQGEIGYDEPARMVLIEQLERGGPAVPDTDPLLFVHAMLQKNFANFLGMSDSHVFCDRGRSA
jgi:predicted ATPase